MSHQSQRPKRRTDNEPTWSAVENCWISSDGRRWDDETRQWLSATNVPRSSVSVGPLTNIQPENQPPSWSYPSPPQAPEYQTSRMRNLSFTSTDLNAAPSQSHYDQQHGASQPSSYDPQARQRTDTNPGNNQNVGSRRPSIQSNRMISSGGAVTESLPIRQNRPGSQAPATDQRSTQHVRFSPLFQRPPTAPSGTPTQATSRHRMQIMGTAERYEQFDHRYQKRKKSFFTPGRVFLVLWSEPSNEQSERISADGRSEGVRSEGAEWQQEKVTKDLAPSIPFVRDRRFGTLIYTKIRRLIVIRDRGEKCICVPIVTYNGQGVAKPGVDKGEHAIAYTGRRIPELGKGEPSKRGEKSMRTPIRIVPDEKGDILDGMSRIDYGRYYTVEKNVNARPFGKVREDCEKDMFYDFNCVFMGEEEYKAHVKEQRRRRSEASRGSRQSAELDEEDTSNEESSDDDDDQQEEGHQAVRAQGTPYPQTPANKGKAPAQGQRPAGGYYPTPTSAPRVAPQLPQTQVSVSGYGPAQYPQVSAQPAHGREQYAERHRPAARGGGRPPQRVARRDQAEDESDDDEEEASSDND